jgi:hypothetical protein
VTPSRTCPACAGTHVRVPLSKRRSYGVYRRLECCQCGHRWTEREAKTGTPPAPRHQCPECSSTDTAVIESRIMPYGRRQRVLCRGCSHRWTHRVGDPQQVRTHARRDAGALTEDEVRLVLTSPLSGAKLARELGRSKEAINAIRRGTFHAKTLPELPRRQAKRRVVPELSCHVCAHWRSSECGMGFPDPIEEGPAFAADCSLYEARSQSISRACPSSLQ